MSILKLIRWKAQTKELINRSIICTEINNDFKSMYGFNFIDEVSVQILIKNSDTVDVLTDNILKYNLSFQVSLGNAKYYSNRQYAYH